MTAPRLGRSFLGVRKCFFFFARSVEGAVFWGPKTRGVCCKVDKLWAILAKGDLQNDASSKVGWGEANFDFGAGS